MNSLKLTVCSYTCINICSIELDALYLYLVNVPRIIIKQNPDTSRLINQSIYSPLSPNQLKYVPPRFEYQKKPLIARITEQQEIILITPKSY